MGDMSLRARTAAAGALLVLLAGCGARSQPEAVAPSPAPPQPTAPATDVALEQSSYRPTAPASELITRPPVQGTPAPPQSDPTAVELARTPRQLASILLTAEAAIRDPAVRGVELAEAAHTQQLVYRRLGRTPQLRTRVIRSLPATLRPAARANIRAGAALASLVTPQPKLPDWRIVRPEPPQRLLRHYHRAAAKFGLEWQYLAAINLVETRMGRIRGRSTAGAQGPMQFMPATWDAYGRGDVNDPADAIEAAARYLAASGAPQNMDGALWSYNHSDKYVAAVSAYAEVMRADPRTYRGYYHWQVYYMTPDGDVHLPEGYGKRG